MTLRKTPLAAFVAAATLGVSAAAYSVVRTAQNAPMPSVGQPAPAYDLPDQDGKTHTSTQDKGHVILLAFYPADFTGGCTREAHALTTAAPELLKMGVKVYGVSVQDSKSHKSFCTQEGITYTLLADTQKVAARAYGVYLPGPSIANRVTFIIDKDGKVAYVDNDVNSHLATCGADWAIWLKAHPAVRGSKSADAPIVARQASQVMMTTMRTSAPAVATVGQTAPAFSLPNVATGTQTSLASLGTGKKATVLLFISTRCPVSNAYDTRMSALAKTYAPKGIAFVGVNANTTEAVPEVAAHSKAHFPFPVLKDANDAVADAYNAHVTPEAYVIDNQGVLVYHGRIDNSMEPGDVKTHDLASALDSLVAGRAVPAKQSAAFGCSIKRGS